MNRSGQFGLSPFYTSSKDQKNGLNPTKKFKMEQKNVNKTTEWSLKIKPKKSKRDKKWAHIKSRLKFGQSIAICFDSEQGRADALGDKFCA